MLAKASKKLSHGGAMNVTNNIALIALRKCIIVAALLLITTGLAFSFDPDSSDIRKGGGDGSGFWLLLLIFLAPMFASAFDKAIGFVMAFTTTALPIGLGIYAFEKTPILGSIGVVFGAFFTYLLFISDSLRHRREAREEAQREEHKSKILSQNQPNINSPTASVSEPEQSAHPAKAHKTFANKTRESVIRERSDRAVHGRAEVNFDVKPTKYVILKQVDRTVQPTSETSGSTTITGKPLSKLERTPEAKPEAGPKPFSYTSGTYTSTAKEAHTVRLRVAEITFTSAAGESQEFELTTDDLKQLETNIFDCKPDTIVKDAPCEETRRIDLVAIVNAGESLRIRICADGLFHENIHGWVHRAFQDEDYCYWAIRLWELEDQSVAGSDTK